MRMNTRGAVSVALDRARTHRCGPNSPGRSAATYGCPSAGHGCGLASACSTSSSTRSFTTKSSSISTPRWDAFVRRVDEYPSKGGGDHLGPKEKIREAPGFSPRRNRPRSSGGCDRAAEQLRGQRPVAHVPMGDRQPGCPGGRSKPDPDVVNVGTSGARDAPSEQFAKRLGGKVPLASRFAILQPRCVWTRSSRKSPTP